MKNFHRLLNGSLLTLKMHYTKLKFVFFAAYFTTIIAGRKGQEDRRRKVDRRSARQKEPEKEKEADPAEELLLLPGQGGQDDAHQGTPTQIRGGQVENCQNEGRTKVQTFLIYILSFFLSCIKFKPFLIFFRYSVSACLEKDAKQLQKGKLRYCRFVSLFLFLT